jgi:hypothetical protein
VAVLYLERRFLLITGFNPDLIVYIF